MQTNLPQSPEFILCRLEKNKSQLHLVLANSLESPTSLNKAGGAPTLPPTSCSVVFMCLG